MIGCLKARVASVLTICRAQSASAFCVCRVAHEDLAAARRVSRSQEAVRAGDRDARDSAAATCRRAEDAVHVSGVEARVSAAPIVCGPARIGARIDPRPASESARRRWSGRRACLRRGFRIRHPAGSCGARTCRPPCRSAFRRDECVWDMPFAGAIGHRRGRHRQDRRRPDG